MSHVPLYHISHIETHCHYLLAWSSLAFFPSYAMSAKKTKGRPNEILTLSFMKKYIFSCVHKKTKSKKITKYYCVMIQEHSRMNIYLD
jgi:hypothetical protein